MANLGDLTNLINESKTIAIFAHAIPDADAFCSSIALRDIINNNFDNTKKKIDIYIPLPEGVPALYEPVVGDNVLNKKTVKGRYDLGIALDSPASNRFSFYEDVFAKSKTTVNIDHHQSNTMFAQYNFVLPKASSVGEMLYAFSKTLGLKLDDSIAKNIYTSIITDTNCLTSLNISKITYKTLANLAAYNFDQEEIKSYFFKTNSKAKTFLLEKAIRSMKFYKDDSIAIMQLAVKEFERYEANMEDTLGIIDHAINIEGVKVAGILIESQENDVYVSLRGKGDVNVATIATEFGGGGHADMAAFQSQGNIAEIKTNLVKVIKQNLMETEVQKDNDMTQS